MELVQNADDNTYDRGVEPTLVLDFQAGNVVVRCNEVGFSPENVRAICDVSASTKKKEKGLEGFIGTLLETSYPTRVTNILCISAQVKKALVSSKS